MADLEITLFGERVRAEYQGTDVYLNSHDLIMALLNGATQTDAKLSDASRATLAATAQGIRKRVRDLPEPWQVWSEE